METIIELRVRRFLGTIRGVKGAGFRGFRVRD